MPLTLLSYQPVRALRQLQEPPTLASSLPLGILPSILSNGLEPQLAANADQTILRAEQSDRVWSAATPSPIQHCGLLFPYKFSVASADASLQSSKGRCADVAAKSRDWILNQEQERCIVIQILIWFKANICPLR